MKTLYLKAYTATHYEIGSHFSLMGSTKEMCRDSLHRGLTAGPNSLDTLYRLESSLNDDQKELLDKHRRFATDAIHHFESLPNSIKYHFTDWVSGGPEWCDYFERREVHVSEVLRQLNWKIVPTITLVPREDSGE